MRKEKWFIRLLKKLGIIKEKALSDDELRGMCIRSIRAHICPQCCDKCAWGIMMRSDK